MNADLVFWLGGTIAIVLIVSAAIHPIAGAIVLVGGLALAAILEGKET